MMLTSLLLECVCLFVRVCLVCLPASVYAVAEAAPYESHYGLCNSMRGTVRHVCMCVFVET